METQTPKTHTSQAPNLYSVMQLFIELKFRKIMPLKVVFLLPILGLWTVCEKYRKLMNELAQVVDLNNIDPAAAVAEFFFLQARDIFSCYCWTANNTRTPYVFWICYCRCVAKEKPAICILTVSVRSEVKRALPPKFYFLMLKFLIIRHFNVYFASPSYSKLAYMLQVKVKLRLKFFNLG